MGHKRDGDVCVMSVSDVNMCVRCVVEKEVVQAPGAGCGAVNG